MRKAFLAVSFLIVACGGSVRAQDPRPDAKIPACNTPARIAALQQAKLVLSIDRTRYSLKDQMVVDVAIRNDGKNDIYVYSKNGWEFDGFLFEFRDNAGSWSLVYSIMCRLRLRKIPMTQGFLPNWEPISFSVPALACC